MGGTGWYWTGGDGVAHWFESPAIPPRCWSPGLLDLVAGAPARNPGPGRHGVRCSACAMLVDGLRERDFEAPHP